MDVLWQRQASLQTILKTLPADSWVVTDGVFVRERLICSLPHSDLTHLQSLSRNLSDDE